MAQTDTQTDKHGNFMTELAQCSAVQCSAVQCSGADSVKINLPTKFDKVVELVSGVSVINGAYAV